MFSFDKTVEGTYCIEETFDDVKSGYEAMHENTAQKPTHIKCLHTKSCDMCM